MTPAEAAVALAAAARGDSTASSPCYRLWHFPPDEPWETWTLFGGNGSRDALLREVRWDRTDHVLIREVALHEDDFHSLRVHASFLGLDPENIGTGFPITEFGIEGFARGPSIIAWDRPVPRGLHAIAAWHSRTRARFLSLLDAGPTSG